MQFIFQNNRSASEQKIYDTALDHQWHVQQVIPAGEVSPAGTEAERLKYASVLVSLAFGEATAFYGFGQRIAEANDISAKSWLITHLLDECRHTEGFTRLLDYLYPSHRGRHETLLGGRDVFVFYGHTHRCSDLTEWLICTQIAEIFGMFCYGELKRSLAADPVAAAFFGHILEDESRHIAYIGSLIRRRRENIPDSVWNSHYQAFTEKMVGYARNMFEARCRGANFAGFASLNIDVSGFCDQATSMILRRLFREAA